MSESAPLNFRPVFVGMFLYVLLINLIPKVITKPTGIKMVDDIVMFALANKDSALPGALLIGLTVFGANYIDCHVL
jgi:hypothetical protein